MVCCIWVIRRFEERFVVICDEQLLVWICVVIIHIYTHAQSRTDAHTRTHTRNPHTHNMHTQTHRHRQTDRQRDRRAHTHTHTHTHTHRVMDLSVSRCLPASPPPSPPPPPSLSLSLSLSLSPMRAHAHAHAKTTRAAALAEPRVLYTNAATAWHIHQRTSVHDYPPKPPSLPHLTVTLHLTPSLPHPYPPSSIPASQRPPRYESITTLSLPVSIDRLGRAVAPHLLPGVVFRTLCLGGPLSR